MSTSTRLRIRGQSVLSAGEITFGVENEGNEGNVVLGVTNQSTGYCPEPDSWAGVRLAVERTGLPHPPGFTTEFVFRRCETCHNTNLVKEGWFECGVCGAVLPAQWNFAPDDVSV